MKRQVPRLHGAAKALARGELIGLGVTVTEAADAGIVGLSGRVVDETLHTFVVQVPSGRRIRLAKAGATFSFHLPSGDVSVEGRAIVFRPTDRTKKVR